MNEPMTKAELLGLIETEHARLEAILAPLSEAQMTEGSLASGWSVKDMLAHLTWWEQRMLQVVQAAARGERLPRLSREGEDEEATINRVNAETYQANHLRPLHEVRADFQRSYRQVVELVHSLSDDDLAPVSSIAQTLGGPLQPLIAANTYDHYREHSEMIRSQAGKRETNA
jgi:uncharacterized protein (TIGR03083 family)